MSDSQDETKVQPAVGADGTPRGASSSSGSGSSSSSRPTRTTDAPASGSASNRGGSSNGSSGSTSNGSARPVSAQGSAGRSGEKPSAQRSPSPAPSSSASAATKAPSSSTRSSSSPRSESGRTLTAADYARTTRGGADNTSVIPAIADSGSNASSSPGRQARLRLNHVEPWSVTRLAFLISVLMMIVAFFAVIIFWIVLDVTGVWDQLNGSVTNVLADDSGDFDLTDYLGLGRITGLTLILSFINVIVFTALATIGAHLYNLGAQLLGGIEVTFSDD